MTKNHLSGQPLPEEYQSRFLREHFCVKMYHEPGLLSAELSFEAHHEGPPGHAHGGSIATVLDEAMGVLAFLSGHKVLAGKLAVRYRLPTPLHVPLRALCSVKQQRGRQINVTSQLITPQGTSLAQAEGLYVDIKEQFDSLSDASARL